MTAGKCGTTRCGLCRFYSHEGRRGGLCQQLNVNVDSSWKACCLAESPFPSSAEPVAGIAELAAAPRQIVAAVPMASEPVHIPAAMVKRLGTKTSLSAAIA